MRANNLPRLTSLPPHIATWGTGSLAQVGKKDAAGDGLEVLDLGNCSLPLSSIQKLFLGKVASGGAPRFPHLRSLTLSANPLCLEAEGYAAQLQDSPQLPKLQIIDTRRLVERKRAGMQPESKRERKQRERAEGKRKPTGANVDSGARKMRTWGAGADTEGDAGAAEDGERPKKEKKAKKPEDEDEDEETRRIRQRMERAQAAMDVDEDEDAEEGGDDGGKKKRKRKRTRKAAEPEPEAVPERPAKKLRDAPASAPAPAAAGKPKPKPDTKDKGKGKPKKKGPDQAALAAVVADPTTAKASKPSRSETAVVGVVDVKKEKKKDDGGVDLAAVLKGDSGTGLGVGGW